MDWELKASAWDSSEMGREDDTRLAALVGSSSSLGVHKNGGGFSVDFKLGGLGDLGDGSVMRKLKEPGGGGGGSTMGSSASGSSKRTRAINGPQNVSCLVDGCAADLSNCREYHRRHRVCERHSKTPVVFVGGKEQRFCQQCSRFQSLGEFDEEKRSCRKRLDGHNRRRRKPQPEAFYMNSGTFSSNYQGLLQFSGLQAYATSTAGVVPTWPTVAEHCQDLHVTDQRSTIPSSLACIYNGDKRFPFLLASNPERSNQAVPEVSIRQQLVNNRTSSPARDTFHQKISSDGLTQSVDSKHAHSLLSSHLTQNFETSLSHLFQRDLIHPNQPVGTGLHFDGLAQYSRSQGVEEKPPLLVPRASNANNLCNRCFKCRLMICGKKGPHKCFHSAGSS